MRNLILILLVFVFAMPAVADEFAEQPTYPEREVDHPYSMPKGMGHFQVGLDLITLRALYFEYGLSDRFAFTMQDAFTPGLKWAAVKETGFEFGLGANFLFYTYGANAEAQIKIGSNSKLILNGSYQYLNLFLVKLEIAQAAAFWQFQVHPSLVVGPQFTYGRYKFGSDIIDDFFDSVLAEQIESWSIFNQTTESLRVIWKLGRTVDLDVAAGVAQYYGAMDTKTTAFTWAAKFNFYFD